VSWPNASVFAIALGLATGCAEHLHSIRQGSGWSTHVLFWPPPDATSSWFRDAAPAAGTLGDAMASVARNLRQAGYADLRWFPIGANYEHGFAVTTRLEQTDQDGAAKPFADRWPAEYAEAANLQWLTDCRTPYLARPGRYRVFLVAFTDLHVPVPGRPVRVDTSTAMDGPDFPVTAIPTRRRVTAAYRVGVYIYEYESGAPGEGGTFVSRDEKVGPADQIKRSGLSVLAAGI
jgi:hypothetical protein